MIPASHPSTPETETEFDWDEADSSDEEEKQANEHAKEVEEHHRHKHNVKRAKRLRKVYLACMRLSRPVRTLLFLLIGCGILVIPAVVVWTRYNHAPNQVRDNVRVWSLWLCILWGCEWKAERNESFSNTMKAAAGSIIADTACSKWLVGTRVGPNSRVRNCKYPA